MRPLVTVASTSSRFLIEIKVFSLKGIRKKVIVTFWQRIFFFFFARCLFYTVQQKCNILTFDRAVNQETGASGRGCQNITLTRGRVEFGADATLTGSRWMSNNYITWCHRRLELVGVSCSWSLSCSSRQWEPAPDRGLAALSDPPSLVEQPSRMRKKYCYSQRNPFENKVWEVYFSKEVCSFVIIVDYVSAYIYIYVYVLCSCMWLYNKKIKIPFSKLDGHKVRVQIKIIFTL